MLSDKDGSPSSTSDSFDFVADTGAASNCGESRDLKSEMASTEAHKPKVPIMGGLTPDGPGQVVRMDRRMSQPGVDWV
jgi:hypothetical protein